MNDEANDPSSLESVIAEFIEADEHGQTPDMAEFLARYPQHEGELRSFFRNHHFFSDSSPEGGTNSIVGSTIGRYQIESEIARGGMGVVFRARQLDLQRDVALKLVGGGVLASREERKRFRIEAEAAAALHHPGIVAIHETGSFRGQEFFSMALVEGPTLQQIIDSGPLPFDDVARITAAIADAVAYAHSVGVVHRDLKPDNILMADRTRPMISDFGLAKCHGDAIAGGATAMTVTGQVLGTPAFMSPQQAAGLPCDACADVYSIGAILYAMLTGRPPHIGDGAGEILRSVIQDEPPRPRTLSADIPPVLETICLRAVARDPDQRYADAASLAEDLHRFRRGDDISAEQSGLFDRLIQEVSRDQHGRHFVPWNRVIARMAWVILLSHLAIFVLGQSGFSRPLAYWLPRLLMMSTIAAIIYRARGGDLSPRTIAERPLWSIWIGYLMALGSINVLSLTGQVADDALFPLTALLSGFGFVAMGGHIWGGSAVIGLFFLVVALISVLFPVFAPVVFGLGWFAGLRTIAWHYGSGTDRGSGSDRSDRATQGDAA